MNILVTGGRGFIGSRLARELSAKGHKVTSFDAVEGQSITSRERVQRALNGIEIVYHLAAELDESSPTLFEVNVQGTKNILEEAAKSRVSQFIYLSSTGVAGKTTGIVDETFPLKPETRYEESKAEAEKLVLAYQEALPVTVVRSALVLGPNKYWHEIIGLVRKEVPLIGNGNNYWQVVYVDDLVSALVFLLGKEESIGEVFIVAEEKPMKLRELVLLLKKQLGLKQEIKTIPAFVARIAAFAYKLFGKKTFLSTEHINRLVRERHYSIKKITAIGWKPAYSTEKAVAATVYELEKQEKSS
ncbi:MAG: NAD(P)-dependent oxidoreductase [Candidatus Diapherotrites archaeon]|uniref:NAD(P)-dependent oxidoreductase n=1 Tax=Candidatus Iainarchaeum sp. TaxID=3101447 RepID=A0A7J4IQS1_9ARCH|nr:MAG: UDP-glucose 4-epimerase [archaeon GW2011_AR10]MBS3059429.1 NAD(P)-dependent oxidoreductase [Candidatus Diapherotrites archaeon]HIH07853.1 NAD(P)-dependent oxidoreductase [Candidatus Diapherotrites archaeon]